MHYSNGGYMARSKDRIQTTLLIRADVWVRFKNLCGSSGISLNHGLERVIIDAINQGRVPGIEPLPMEEFDTEDQTPPLIEEVTTLNADAVAGRQKQTKTSD